MTAVHSLFKSFDENIKYQRENSLWNHVLTVIRRDADGLSGTVNQQEFKVWKYNYWVGLFHPVVYGKIDSKNDKPKIVISSKMNLLGQLIAILLLGLWTYGILTGMVIQEDNSWTFLWRRILIGLFMIILPVIAFGLAFRYEYKKEREKIKNVCQQNLRKHGEKRTES
jgi:hypothetical protein